MILEKAMQDKITDMGEENSKTLFMIFNKTEDAGDTLFETSRYYTMLDKDGNYYDKTHIRRSGSEFCAEYIVQNLEQQHLLQNNK